MWIDINWLSFWRWLEIKNKLSLLGWSSTKIINYFSWIGFKKRIMRLTWIISITGIISLILSCEIFIWMLSTWFAWVIFTVICFLCDFDTTRQNINIREHRLNSTQNMDMVEVRSKNTRFSLCGQHAFYLKGKIVILGYLSIRK